MKAIKALMRYRGNEHHDFRMSSMDFRYLCEVADAFELGSGTGMHLKAMKLRAEGKTLRAVGVESGYTAERIRQIQAKLLRETIRKLRFIDHALNATGSSSQLIHVVYKNGVLT